MKEYIERAAAEQAIHAIMPSMSTLDGAGANDEVVFAAQEMCADVLSAVHHLPAADVAEVRHGRWIVSEMNFGYCDIIQKEYTAKKYTCSECGYKTGDQAKKFVCCPICMARMDKEDEHES